MGTYWNSYHVSISRLQSEKMHIQGELTGAQVKKEYYQMFRSLLNLTRFGVKDSALGAREKEPFLAILKCSSSKWEECYELEAGR